jgi:hypothetical protein
MVDYLLSRSIRRQFEAFAAGFKILCDGPAIRLFNACEVGGATVCGRSVDDLAGHARGR